jgi:LPS O-antigen subunit length determinant protein (WzzB/FepE family)
LEKAGSFVSSLQSVEILNEHFSKETKAEGKSQAEVKTANSNEERERERERESTEIKKCIKQMHTAPKALRRHELVHEV